MQSRAPPSAIGFDARSAGNAKNIHTRRVFGENRDDSRSEANHQHYDGHYCGVSWRDGSRPRRDAEFARYREVRRNVLVQILAATAHAFGEDERRDSRGGEEPAAGSFAGKAARNTGGTALGNGRPEVRVARQRKITARESMVGTYFLPSSYKFLFPRAVASGTVPAGSGDGSDSEWFVGGAGSLERRFAAAAIVRWGRHFSGTDRSLCYREVTWKWR